MMHLQAFFEARTGIHIPTLLGMRRETLNPNIGTGTPNLNVQAVFILSFFCFFFLRLFHFRVVLENH